MQEGSTWKAIRLTQLQAYPKRFKNILPKLFEQTTKNGPAKSRTYE
jgi:hypothetical protein